MVPVAGGTFIYVDWVLFRLFLQCGTLCSEQNYINKQKGGRKIMVMYENSGF